MCCVLMFCHPRVSNYHGAEIRESAAAVILPTEITSRRLDIALGMSSGLRSGWKSSVWWISGRNDGFPCMLGYFKDEEIFNWALDF